MKIVNAVMLLMLALGGLPLRAEVLWQDFSVSYLNGSNYRVDGPDKQVLTFEHAAGTSWGDSFLFLDHLRGDNGSRSNYAEWSPRLSLSKLSGQQLQFGLIKDVLLTSTVEMSSLRTDFLYGVATDLAVPGFNYLKLNFYRRNNDGLAGNWQLTTTWAIPFSLGEQQFLYDGFLDWYSTTADQRASMNMTSQLKWALHPLFNLKSKLYVGVEYVYWRNKYGIADSPAFRTNESNVNLLIKAHF
ncbi:MAG: nucleoside-binding protein [Gammaproteobacteria bacterium]|nr:nucleoside-binding protein [Gammaproteobacteria bacterium]MBU1556226.1 nucleoside-binding protein [Gammaproteobacteria bacterium]MBU2071545.1 nucleoside-binding protein [Gammaproteobacteria bacterium]MBU2184036.1 nucleoside-binding protein [Gammaproteobacteria bacterium]MBU2206878.1 nucleoside-binding protein [Gammaproteobacteria bacterium]